MKIKISKEVKIGLYALGTIVIMYWVFNFLKGRDLFNKYNTYYANYENIEGLPNTAPVYLKGLKVGSVSKIAFEKEEKLFTVTLRIERVYGVPENSIAEIYGTDIMGNKAVRIIMGNSPRLAVPDDYLETSVASDFTNMMAQELLPLKDKLEQLVNNLNVTVTSVNNVLTEDTQKNLEASILNLRKTLQHVEGITASVNGQKEHLNNTMENIDVFTASLRNNSANIDAITGNLAQVSDSLRQADIKGTVTRLNTLLAQAGDTTGTVGQLLYNDELYRRLSTTLNDLDILIKDLKENPKRYVRLSLF